MKEVLNMARRIYCILSILIVSAIILLPISCKKEPNTPKQDTTPARKYTSRPLTVNPARVEAFYPGHYVQFVVTRGPDPVLCTFSSSNSEIVAVDSEGRIRHKGVGKVNIYAINKGDTAIIPVNALPKPELIPFLPYMRFFDGEDAIIAYEEAQGHKLSIRDASMGSLTFTPSMKEEFYFSSITYLNRRLAFISCDSATINDPKIVDYFSKLGYSYDKDKSDQWNASFPETFHFFKTSRHTTSTTYLVLKNTAKQYGYTTGIVVEAVAPTLDANATVPFPYMKWGATPEQVRTWEESRGSKFMARASVEGKDNRHKEVYSIKEDRGEYTYLEAPRYVFEDGKLIGVTVLVSPIELWAKSAGDVFEVVPPAEQILKRDFPQQEKKKVSPTIEVVIYKNQDKEQKFFLQQWNIKVNGSGTLAIGFVFLPYAGDDYIDLENKD